MPDPGTERGLGHMQLPGGFQKAAMSGNRQKGAGLLNIHNTARQN